MRNLQRTAILILVMHLLETGGWAGSGGGVTLPLPGIVQKRTSGLQLEVYSHWVESPGYRPMFVTVSSFVPAPADRYLDVVVVPNDWTRTRQEVEFQIKLPQGATSVTKEIAAPQFGIWNSLQITTYENGQKLDDLSAAVGMNRTVAAYSWTEAYPSMLFIDADAPHAERINSIVAGSQADGGRSLPDVLALGKLVAPLDDYSQNVWQNETGRRDAEGNRLPSDDEDVLSTVQRLQTVELSGFAELPTQWLNYTCLDLIFVSLDDLRMLSEQRPDAWTAIRDYVVAGGNLIVFGVGDEFATLPDIDQLLDPRRIPSAAPNGDSSGAWQSPRESSFGVDLAVLSTPSNVVQSFNRDRVVLEEEDFVEDDDPWRRTAAAPPPNVSRWRALGWGRVLAITPGDLNEVSNEQWAWALNDVGVDRWRWYRRHGLSRQRPNQGFWNFLIPGVGAAPVRTFLIVITAFVFVIGPVNYFFLKRSRRLYLLLVTVPLGSAVIIGSLFSFALFKDGLGTRARLRSFSQIMPDGQVVSWSRQSYYAGLAPSSGVIYPQDAAVFPIDYQPERQLRSRRGVRWRNVQQLAPGHLNARSTSQYLVIHGSRPEAAPMTIERTADGTLRATNSGATRVDHVLVHDGGKMFWVSDLAPGATRQGEPVSPVEANDRYASLLREHRPAVPPGFTAPGGRNRLAFYYYNNFDNGFGPPDFQSNLMEAAIAKPPTQLGPTERMYYAVTTAAPEFIPIGVEGCRQEAGFHVIQGTW